MLFISMESVLAEIIAAQNNNENLTCFLQPYKPHIIKRLEADTPSSVSPLTAYISVTTDLANVSYKGKIIGWENKKNYHMKKYNP